MIYECKRCGLKTNDTNFLKCGQCVNSPWVRTPPPPPSLIGDEELLRMDAEQYQRKQEEAHAAVKPLPGA